MRERVAGYFSIGFFAVCCLTASAVIFVLGLLTLAFLINGVSAFDKEIMLRLLVLTGVSVVSFIIACILGNEKD